ncbi:hypothetical protein AGMMS49587_13570 [Spirochaetia bacterium]|nr:hypothetical protein AGMMS49587_13570 [Spirochaetia bacterium]
MGDFKIGSFNCLHGSVVKEDICPTTGETCNQTLAKIIRLKQIDIIALQEYNAANKFAESKWKMLLGGKWNILPCDYSSSFAILYNHDKFTHIKYDEDDMCSRQYRNIINKVKSNGYGGELQWKPQIICFRPKNEQKIEIRIINAHIRFSEKRPEQKFVHIPEAQLITRKNEFDIMVSIYDDVNFLMFNGSVYTLMAGDFNMEQSHIEPFLREKNNLLSKLHIKRRATLGLKQLQKSSLHEKKQLDYFNASYDHFIVNSEIGTADSFRFDTVKQYFTSDNEKHYSEFSDHVPIIMDFSIR